MNLAAQGRRKRWGGMRSKLARFGLVAGAVLAMASPALANNSGYFFIIDHRYVNGSSNGVTHGLDAGNLTISGELWVYQKYVKPVGPHPITIEVWQAGFFDKSICSVTVVPSTTIGKKTSFSKDCGLVPTAVFFVVGWKVNDDGWDIKTTGLLTTK